MPTPERWALNVLLQDRCPVSQHLRAQLRFTHKGNSKISQRTIHTEDFFTIPNLPNSWTSVFDLFRVNFSFSRFRNYIHH